MRTTEKKIQEKVEKIQKRYEGGVAFWSFGMRSHVNKNEKKIVTNQKLKISKIQNITFVRTTEKKNQKKFERIQKWFEGGVAF